MVEPAGSVWFLKPRLGALGSYAVICEEKQERDKDDGQGEVLSPE